MGDRDGERFVSPSEQPERIGSACERDGLELVEVIEELDVSGGTPIAKRRGLRRAIELVETRHAELIIVAYFDRLVRSLSVQREVVERVEAAGGGIVALEVGEVRADTGSRWLSSTMLGMVAELRDQYVGDLIGSLANCSVSAGGPQTERNSSRQRYVAPACRHRLRRDLPELVLRDRPHSDELADAASGRHRAGHRLRRRPARNRSIAVNARRR